MTLQRVLLVEDDPIIASGIATLLQMEGIAVRIVEYGRDVLNAIASFCPDVLVLDLTLPDISGMDVYAAVKEAHPDLPVILSSGRVDAELPVDSQKVALLRKPYEFAELLAILRKLTS